MATKPIDYEFTMHAHRAGGGRARNKMMELKEDLKEWHGQAGSEVQGDEKGCFGGAYNAWYRGGCEEAGKAYDMMVLECVNVGMLYEIMKVDVDFGPMMEEEQVEELEGFKLKLSKESVSAEELQAGLEICESLKEDGLASYSK